ncbi:hypothetical protein [Cupriavidus sp. HMR-1]|uniref:hypothetical protein n=1 Tax=Cupriavidus sp. HMR-1 TaxID=1249621 RepID=UPI000586AB42|nr:hypothetical protein [Cupriavidus sp. HMR-1]
MRTEPCTLPRLRARGPSLWAVLWLVACLLLAQHAGLVHRVLHGGLPNASQPALTVTVTVTSDDATHTEPFSLKLGLHSCVLFDGATVADIHVGSFHLPLLAFGKPVKPANLAWRWPDLPSAQPFRSRAPPAAFAFA